MHITFKFFVALNELPQHGQIYLRVLDGFRVFGGIAVPLPAFAPPIPVNENCVPLTN